MNLSERLIWQDEELYNWRVNILFRVILVWHVMNIIHNQDVSHKHGLKKSHRKSGVHIGLQLNWLPIPNF